MKKIVSAVLVCMLLVGCVFAVTSCGGKTLSGEYSSSIADLAGTTYKFSGSKVEITYEVFGFEKTIEGTYEITTDENEKSTITFTFEAGEEDADDYKGAHSFSEGTEDGKDYIKIDGIKYTKVK